MANAQQIEFLNDGIHVDGTPLSGGTIYFYGAGTLVAKDAYRDAAKTDNVESITIGTDGRPQDGAGDATAVYGDGNYRLIVKDADAVTVMDLDNMYYALPTATSNAVTITTSTGDPVSATTSDEIILVTTGGNAINVNLPAAATSGLKKTIKKVDAGGGTVVINKAGSDTIQGAASVTLSLHNESIELIADGDATWEQSVGTHIVDGTTIGGNASVGGTFSAAGNTTIGGTLAVTSDVTLSASVLVDTIAEKTATNGVDIDSCLIKDGGVEAVIDQGGGNNLKCKVVDIGDWDMNRSVGGNSTIQVALGVAHTNTRAVSAVIRDDNDVTYYPLSIGTGIPTGYVATLRNVSNANNALLAVEAGSTFDSTTFDSTSYNRGWITVWYTE